MLGLLQLCRPYYAVPISLIYMLIICYAREGNMEPQWSGVIVSTISLSLLIMSGHVLNDVFDVEVDCINSPRRPIPSGRIKRRTACIFGLVLLTGAVTAGAFCRPLFVSVLLVVAVMLAIYNRFSKRMGFMKPIAVAILMVSIYPLAFAQAGMITGSRAGSLVVFPVWVFLVAWSYELMKDVRDLPGDSSAAGLTDHIRRNFRLCRRIADAIGLFAAPLLVVPFFLGCGWIYLAFISVSVCIRFVSVFLPVRKAIVAIYIEVFIVGAGATLDVMIIGF